MDWSGSSLRHPWDSKSLSDIVGHHMKWMEFMGIALIILGVISLGSLVATSVASVFFVGSILGAAGIAQLVNAFGYWRKQWGGFFLGLALGALYVFAGIFCFVRPGSALVGITYVIGWCFIVVGIMRAVFAASTGFPGWGWSVLSGLISFILGVMILSAWPGGSILVLGTLVGIELIAAGISFLVTGLTVRHVLSAAQPGAGVRPITRFQH